MWIEKGFDCSAQVTRKDDSFFPHSSGMVRLRTSDLGLKEKVRERLGQRALTRVWIKSYQQRLRI